MRIGASVQAELVDQYQREERRKAVAILHQCSTIAGIPESYRRGCSGDSKRSCDVADVLRRCRDHCDSCEVFSVPSVADLKTYTSALNCENATKTKNIQQTGFAGRHRPNY